MAVRRHSAEHRYGSMVLMSQNAGAARFYVLIMEWDDLFVLRHWDRRDGARTEIGPGTPVPDDVRRPVGEGVPGPRGRVPAGGRATRGSPGPRPTAGCPSRGMTLPPSPACW